jgi:hypothetical protein
VVEGTGLEIPTRAFSSVSFHHHLIGFPFPCAPVAPYPNCHPWSSLVGTNSGTNNWRDLMTKINDVRRPRPRQQ